MTPHAEISFGTGIHYKLASQCLKAGRHVVTEKPFVLTTNECDRLIKQAGDQRVVVSTYHNRHWDGWILRAVREIVQKRALGNVIRIDAAMGEYAPPKDWWRSNKTISGGILYDMGVHLLEYCLQLISSSAVEVSGFATHGHWAKRISTTHSCKRDCIEDDAAVIVRFANGAMVQLNISQLTTDQLPYFLKIRCTGGTYLMNWKQWTIYKPGRGGRIVKKTGKHLVSRHKKYYQNIVDHLTGQASLIITPQWARRPIHIIDLANRSAKLGRALKTKYG